MGRLYDLFYYFLNHTSPDPAAFESLLGPGTRIVSYRKGAPIFTNFDPVNACYILYEGVCEGVQWSSSGIKDTFLVQDLPNFTDLTAIVNRFERHTNTLVVLSEQAKAVEIDRDFFWEQLERDSRLSILLLQDATYKLLSVSNKLMQRRFYSAQDNLLLYLYEQWGLAGCPEPFCLVQSNRAIADLIGVSERTIYRALRCFSDEGLLAVQDGNFHMDAQQLRMLRERAEELRIVEYL